MNSKRFYNTWRTKIKREEILSRATVRTKLKFIWINCLTQKRLIWSFSRKIRCWLETLYLHLKLYILYSYINLKIHLDLVERFYASTFSQSIFLDNDSIFSSFWMVNISLTSIEIDADSRHCLIHLIYFTGNYMSFII